MTDPALSAHAAWALARGFPPPVVRYVVTHLNRDGVRTLTYGAQGRWTYATFEEASDLLAALVVHNGPARLASIFGPQALRFEVRPCECWPGHFDPCGVWFD